MGLRVLFFLCFTTTALVCVSSRAVNISNTWMLPEEGFPVFYRYFRDRISWYEADAVCQFHHANLVTVENTSEFDAVRAYLKELDIANNVWIGLSKSGEKSKFTWSNFRPLSNEGYWQEAIPVGTNPLCAVADPVADYRWHALPCGGPEVAGFICELPVPLWATGSGGCLLTEIPSLTVLYIPEQSAIELTSDCGLDGTKRITCKGNADRDEMIKQLACAITNEDDDEKTTKLPYTVEITTSIVKTTKPWTSNTIGSDEYGSPTRHRRETENTLSPTTSTVSSMHFAMSDKTTSLPETTTVNNVNDFTLGLSINQKTDKFDSTSTSALDLTSIKSSNVSEGPSEIPTVTTMPVDSEPDDTAEYPGAINQGHLFGIIENGTMFDIIELNETGTEESTIVSIKPETTTPESFTGLLYTTIIYHKEPTEVIPKTDQNIGKEYKQEATPIFKQEYSDKSLKKTKTMNDLLNEEDDKALTKEIELLPVLPAASTNLNRTGRKKLPHELQEDDFVIVDESASHKVVEIKLHKDNSNYSHTQLFITTRVTDKSKKIETQPKSNIRREEFKSTTTAKTSTELEKSVSVTKDEAINTTPFKNFDTTAFGTTQRPNNGTTRNGPETTQQINTETEPIFDLESEYKETDHKETEIRPKIGVLNTENNTINLESESVTHLKKQLLPKPFLDSDIEINEIQEVVADDPQETASAVTVTGEPSDVIPQQQQKPNRQRLLNKPQRRSFYPYFFSRVLG